MPCLQSEKDTAGPGWYGLPATEMTPEIKKDIQLIKLRGYVDPKRFYKVWVLGCVRACVYVGVGVWVCGWMGCWASGCVGVRARVCVFVCCVVLCSLARLPICLSQ